MKPLAPSAAPSEALQARIADVLGDLVSSFNDVVDALPDAPARPRELVRALGINQTLASRLLCVLRSPDALAAANALPGPGPLRTVLAAAGRKGVDRSLLGPAEDAVAQYAKLIRRELGGRSGLQAVVSDCVPQAREKFEMAYKQGAYKAMSHLKGAAADVYLLAVLIHPGSDPARHDTVLLSARLGLQRLRPGAIVQRFYRNITPGIPTGPVTNLDGKPVEDIHGPLLPEFSSTPTPQFEVRQQRGCASYVLADWGIGPDSALDLVFADLVRGGFRRCRTPDNQRSAGAAADVELPSKTLVFDILLHKDVWPGSEPTLLIYDTSFRGTADPNDPMRDIDLLDLAESIQIMGHGIRRFQATEISNYVSMLQHVCDKMGWDGTMFRGYRCRIQYPVYGSQVVMEFTLPESPQVRS